jgi:NifU-like protein
MDNYSALIREHFLDPRNVGDVGGTAFIGRAGSITCGATMRLSLRVDATQRIADAKFKAAGCSFLVAATSLLTECIKGKTTGEAAALAQSPRKAMDSLGGVLSDRLQCAGIVCQALVSAIKSFSDSARDEWEGDEALICTCFCVSDRTIENEIRKHELHSIADVTRACNAGAGCRSCYSLIQDALDDYWRELAPASVPNPC